MLSNEWFSIITTTMWSNWGSWSLPTGAFGLGATPTLPAGRVVDVVVVPLVDEPPQAANTAPVAPTAAPPSKARRESLPGPGTGPDRFGSGSVAFTAPPRWSILTLPGV
jgi:hypothetical protein